MIVAMSRAKEVIMKNIMKGNRAAMELTLDGMSEKAGMHRSQISDYESRRQVPSLTRSVQLMKAYDMTFEQMCTHFGIELPKKEEE